MSQHFVLDSRETPIGVLYRDFSVLLEEFTQYVAVVGIEGADGQEAGKGFFL